MRVIAYIDGFNLYYGLKSKGWRWAYWLNLPLLMAQFLKPGQNLVQTKYFTSIVSTPSDKHDRQAVFIEALKTLPDISFYFGHYLAETRVCRQCGHTYIHNSEKKTDVNIATEMLMDAFQNQFDLAFLVSADSDLIPPIKTIQRLFPAKRIVVIFPPDRSSKELSRTANGYTHISSDKLSKSLFPDQVTKPDGFVLQRPTSWR